VAEKDKHDDGHKRKRHHGRRHGSHDEGHEGAPEWLISFADNVVLQMGFFVILLAMNMAIPGAGDGDEGGGGKTREEAILDFAISVRESFNNPVNMTSTRPQDAPLIQRLQERRRKEAGEGGPAGHEQEHQSPRPTGHSSLGGTVMFVDHSAGLSADQERRTRDIGQRIAGLRWIVEIRGHVSAAESFREGGRGWTLSHERARAVADVLKEAGVDERQIRVTACGDTEPVHFRAYEPGEQRTNQRVEIVVTDQVMSNQ
jgi:flagellar motor protein MotB